MALQIDSQTTAISGKVSDVVQASVIASGGVPFVSGCPIGETFYEGGTEEYPFVEGDWNTNYELIDSVIKPLYRQFFSNAPFIPLDNFVKRLKYTVRLNDDYSYILNAEFQNTVGNVVSFNLLGNGSYRIYVGGVWQGDVPLIPSDDGWYDIDIECHFIFTSGFCEIDSIFNVTNTPQEPIIIKKTITNQTNSGIKFGFVNNLDIDYSIINFYYSGGTELPNDCTGTIEDYKYDWHFTDAPEISIGSQSTVELSLSEDMDQRSIQCKVVDDG